ncbi:enoyl-CoA hydratase-related protein [Shimia abyssi]|uniref:2-(1,2-epoxy-1,2-dihydrophenyl)acetyl-CoA isomerase n=1 Tax=Shimia abyssi TaxID=1662395 RepID=A0A2P8FAK5_9RHOB|nr:enoyl-CoA hydratase-related protein [Shimia abyssi]PSL18692.1 2-(1,2-epoxy-1,2-dihydrophenyl)acetyl-CoA isomerase [Shimia abyssi]
MSIAPDPVLMEVEDGIATITLNRPDRLNAITRDMIVLVRSLVDAAAGDDGVRVMLLTGAGRGFCAGQDLSERDPRGRQEPFDLEAIQKELYHPILNAITSTPKPVVARVNGVAAGAGSGLALACDIVIAGQSAKFIQSFAKVGLSVDAGGGMALYRGLGLPRAKAALMLAETLTADEAAQLGLIWKSVPDVALDAEANALAGRLAATPRHALASIKAAMSAAATAPGLAHYLDQEATLQGIAGSHPDYAEGVLSFLEKRKPDFS